MGPPANGNVVEVQLTDGQVFVPANVTIAPGMTVRWRRTSSLLHTVTPDGHQHWQEVVMVTTGQTFERLFPAVGDFPYVCTIHPGMRGTVIVRAQPGAGGGAGGGGEGGGNPGDPNYPGS